MFTLSNDWLAVSILDPIADQERFGVRYCTGGYIFQVEDHKHGPLLTGPTYPDSFNWFDGQGIPDAFNLSPLRKPGEQGPNALVIGIGECDLEARKVLSFCTWDIQQEGTSITMRTSHSYGPYALDLERTVSLNQRTVRSYTKLTNTGEMFLQMRWFPHPFYPQTATDELFRVNFPVSLPNATAYTLLDSGYIGRVGWPWTDIKGNFQVLAHQAQTNLIIQQRHPIVNMVSATCSYVPDFFPVWGNPNTFSWEPYIEQTIGIGQSYDWWIDYDF
jgi:hypothetical protein